MYSRGEENQFLEVTDASGDKAVLYFHDCVSGALIESVVRRAKKFALKRYVGGADKGLTTDACLPPSVRSSRGTRISPNTTNPDDWAKISGKKGERIVHVRSLVGHVSTPERNVEKVVQTGQYL